LSGNGTTTIHGANIKTGTIAAARLELTGYATISSLSGNGTTIINGANITTGQISADRIDVTNLRVRNVYSTGNDLIITSTGTGSSNTLYLGGNQSVSSGTVYLRASSDVVIGRDSSVNYTYNLIFSVTDREMYSSMTWTLGRVTSRLGTIYANTIDVLNISGGTKLGSTSYYTTFDGSGRMTPSTANSTTVSLGTASARWYGYFGNIDLSVQLLIGSSTSGITITTSDLRPNSTSSANNLGTATYPWYNANIGYNNVLIGTRPASYVGFFGVSPVARQAVSTMTGTDLTTMVNKINEIVNQLKRLGLFG